MPGAVSAASRCRETNRSARRKDKTDDENKGEIDVMTDLSPKASVRVG